jgi:hypothetical protein
MDIAKMREFIAYDPETGEMTWKKVLSNRTKPNAVCGGNLDSKGYKRVCFDKKQYRAHRVAWALFYDKEPTLQIDHINGNKLDNRISNLRQATNYENSRNCGISKNNTSGITGVTYHAKAKKWIAQIMVNRQNYYLGLYNNMADAAAARQAAQIQFFQNFSRNAV